MMSQRTFVRRKYHVRLTLYVCARTQVTLPFTLPKLLKCPEDHRALRMNTTELRPTELRLLFRV